MRPLTIVVALDSFKGSLTSVQASSVLRPAAEAEMCAVVLTPGAA